MNAQGMARRAARIAGTLAALLLAQSAVADDTMIVYGKRVQEPDASAIAEPEVDSAGVLVALHADLRASIHADIEASLRDGFSALRMEMAREQGIVSEVKVASLGIRAGA